MLHKTEVNRLNQQQVWHDYYGKNKKVHTNFSAYHQGGLQECKKRYQPYAITQIQGITQQIVIENSSPN